jgi:hypothetical protein
MKGVENEIEWNKRGEWGGGKWRRRGIGRTAEINVV